MIAANNAPPTSSDVVVTIVSQAHQWNNERMNDNQIAFHRYIMLVDQDEGKELTIKVIVDFWAYSIILDIQMS